MPTMTANHSHRRRLEGVGARVYWMPIGRTREDPHKTFPTREFLCSFDPMNKDGDGFWPNATFETNRLVDGTEIAHKIKQEDIDHMKSYFENRKCLLMNQVVYPDWFFDWPPIGINQFVLLDESNSGRGFSDYYEDDGKEYNIFAEPYMPDKYDDRWDFMYTRKAGRRTWTPDWRDSTNTIRVRVMRLNHTKDDWQKVIQRDIFDINEYRRKMEVLIKQNGSMRSQQIHSNAMIYGLVERLEVSDTALNRYIGAWNVGVDALHNMAPKVARWLEDVTGKLESQFGLRTAIGDTPGSVRMENIECENALPIAREHISNLQRGIQEISILDHFKHDVNLIDTLNMRGAQAAVQLFGRDAIERALGLPPTRDSFLSPEMMEIAEKLRGSTYVKSLRSTRQR